MDHGASIKQNGCGQSCTSTGVVMRRCACNAVIGYFEIVGGLASIVFPIWHEGVLGQVGFHIQVPALYF